MFQQQHDSDFIEFQNDVQQENREDDDIGGKGEASPNMLTTLMKTSRKTMKMETISGLCFVDMTFTNVALNKIAAAKTIVMISAAVSSPLVNYVLTIIVRNMIRAIVSTLEVNLTPMPSCPDNRPPILEKDMYDSWKNKLELCMMNRQHGQMILEFVKNGPPIWPTIKENGLPPEVYALERECKLYDEFDKVPYKKGETQHDFYLIFSLLLNHIYNVKLEKIQVNTKFLNTLPLEWSKFVTNVKLVRDLHTTNINQLHAYLGQHEFHANEQGDDPIDAIKHMMSILSAVVTSCYLTTKNQLRNSSDPRQQATINDGRVTLQVVQGRQISFATDLGIIEDQATQTVITHNAAYQADDLDAYDSDCDELNTAKVALMANLSYYGLNVLTEINLDNKSVNDTLTAELERYKEQVKVLKEGQNVEAVEQHRLESKTVEIKMIQVLNKNERLLEQVINKDIVNIVVNLSVDNASVNVHEYKKDNSVSNQSALNFDQYFKLNDLKAQSEEKDTVIMKLKERIKSLSRNVNEDKVKKNIDEIKTINIELDHMLSKLIAKNEHLKQTYKQLYDSIKLTRVRSKEQCDVLINQVNQKSVEISHLTANLQEKGLIIAALKDELRKLKRKALVDNDVTPHTSTLEMLKIDVEPIAPRLLNNRTAHSDYLRLTQEQVAILKENKDKRVRFTEAITSSGNINTQTNSSSNLVSNKPALSSIGVKPSTSASKSQPLGNTKKDKIQRPPSSTQKNKAESYPRTVKSSLKNKNCVDEPKGTTIVQHSKLNANFKLRCVKCNGCMLSDNHDLCVLNDVNDRPKSKSVKKTSKRKVWKLTGKGSIVSDVPSSSLDECKSSKLFSGKSKKKPHKPKSKDTNQEKLYLLHMDLCGPMRVASVNGKKYIPIIVDDYSRFTWVNFLRSKDEAPDFIIKFLKMIQLRLNTPVRRIRIDNGMEFVNQTLREYYKKVDISHETSIACSPQQNVSSSCYRMLYLKSFHHMSSSQKIPYELLHDKLPDLSFFHVFGALCYLTNDSENLGKLQPKADIDFDELAAMAFEQNSLEPALHEMTPVTINSGLVRNPPPSTPFVPPSRIDWYLLFQPLFDEILNPSHSVDHPAPEFIAPIVEVVDPIPAESTGSPSSTTVDQDAPSVSNSQTLTKIQSPFISNDVEEKNHDLDVAHINNDPFFCISIPENVAEASSSSDVILTVVHTTSPNSEHVNKWTKDHPLDNIIGKLERPVSTRLQLHEQASFCYYDAFLSSVEPKTYKDALTQACWIESMQKELNEFERLEVWELVPRTDKVMVITLKRIYESKYALESLKKYGMESNDHVDTPMVEKSKLDEDQQGKAVDPTHYRGMVGTLMYLTASRPDLTFILMQTLIMRVAKILDEVHLELADIFTKALGRERIEFLINKLGMRSFTPKTLKQLEDEAEE
uniref:Integrase catalytic domain-containing protein n=1 Tax=Tanacetum cinerariifolium TaxID=118510 RepID=A0A6L2ML52_TANCI|nr:hypothetical protein [Tanacetum cinerariifolium]